MSAPLPSLLLLPPPPTPFSPASVAAAYRPAISASVSALQGLPTSTQLFVVLPCPSLCKNREAPRAQVYADVQHLLSRLYSLICIVCANLGVDVESETPGSIDARIILLDYDGSKSFDTDANNVFASIVAGPILDLPTFALTRRRWSTIFSVDGEGGQRLLANYSALANRNSPPLQGHVHIVHGGLSMAQNVIGHPLQAPPSPSKSHSVVAVGGTFDHIHAGHKLLLSATALLLQPANQQSPTPRRLIVGITGDALLKNKKYAEYLKSWKQRQEDVVDFLLSILLFTRSGLGDAIETVSLNDTSPNGKAIHTKLKVPAITIECVEIQDPFGPTITDEDVTALIVSGETRSGGQAVNDKRTEKGWNALDVFEIDVLDAEEGREDSTKTEEFSAKISSTAIRKRKAENGRTSSL